MELKKQVDNIVVKSRTILCTSRLVYLASLSEFYLKVIQMIQKNNIINIKKKYEYKRYKINQAFKLIPNKYKRFGKDYGWVGKIIVKKNKINKKLNIKSIFYQFFRKKKQAFFFQRFKWFYRNSIILKKYYTKFYQFKSSRKFNKRYLACLKIAGNKTYNFLRLLDFRVDLLLVRILFVRNVLIVKYLISLKKIFINGIQLTKINYTFKVKDVVRVFPFQFKSLSLPRRLSKKKFTWLSLIRKKYEKVTKV